jgi:hypothetical protein
MVRTRSLRRWFRRRHQGARSRTALCSKDCRSCSTSTIVARAAARPTPATAQASHSDAARVLAAGFKGSRRVAPGCRVNTPWAWFFCRGITVSAAAIEEGLRTGRRRGRSAWFSAGGASPPTSRPGRTARACEPCMRQVFIGRGPDVADEMAFERKLYVIRKRGYNDIRISSPACPSRRSSTRAC